MEKLNIATSGLIVILTLAGCAVTAESRHKANKILFGQNYNKSCGDLYREQLETSSKERAQEAYDGCMLSN